MLNFILKLFGRKRVKIYHVEVMYKNTNGSVYDFWVYKMDLKHNELSWMSVSTPYPLAIGNLDDIISIWVLGTKMKIVKKDFEV